MKRFRILHLGIVLVLTITLCLKTAWGEEPKQDQIPDRYGLAITYGNTYKPDGEIGFLTLSGVALYDYDRIWRHRAPDALRFKVEFTLGSSTRPQFRFMASTAMLALYYLDFFSTSEVRPYVEAGIGVIYTDFQIEQQGSRVNFNPKAGIGADFQLDSGGPFFAAIRWDHFSNGGICKENIGVNSIVLMLGRYF